MIRQNRDFFASRIVRFLESLLSFLCSIVKRGVLVDDWCVLVQMDVCMLQMGSIKVDDDSILFYSKQKIYGTRQIEMLIYYSLVSLCT